MTNNKLYMAIVEARNSNKLEECLNNLELKFLVMSGKGSAKKSFWDFFGIKDNSKLVYWIFTNMDITSNLQLNYSNKDLFLAKIGDNMSKEKLFVCIINSGFAEDIMDLARELGATGGTILDGRGTGKQADLIFGSEIDSAKEIVTIFCTEDLSKKLENKINYYIKNNEFISGICFTLNAKLYKGINLDNQ